MANPNGRDSRMKAEKELKVGETFFSFATCHVQQFALYQTHADKLIHDLSFLGSDYKYRVNISLLIYKQGNISWSLKIDLFSEFKYVGGSFSQPSNFSISTYCMIIPKRKKQTKKTQLQHSRTKNRTILQF